jgi:hypothetical protein
LINQSSFTPLAVSPTELAVCSRRIGRSDADELCYRSHWPVVRLQEFGSNASFRVLQRKCERSCGPAVGREASNRDHRQSCGVAAAWCRSYLAMSYWSPITIRLYCMYCTIMEVFKVCPVFVSPRPDFLPEQRGDRTSPTYTRRLTRIQVAGAGQQCQRQRQRLQHQQ